MQLFPILRLPYLIQKFILDELSITDLCLLSILSKRAKKLVTSARRSVDGMTWRFGLVTDPDFRQIDLLRTLKLTVPMRMPLEDARRMERFEEWSLNGQLIPMYRFGSSWFLGDPSSENQIELLDMLSRHFTETFRCQSFNLFTNAKAVSEDLFVFKITREFKKLNLEGNEPVAEKHLKFVLEQLEIKESLRVQHNIPGFQWNGSLKMESFSAWEADWLTFEALMNNECKKLEMVGHTFTSSQLNEFVKKWIAGGFPNLEFCELVAEETLSRTRTLQGIETTPYNPDNRPDEHPRGNEDLPDGVDIRRNDGVYATIEIDYDTLKMWVWNDI